MGRDRIRARLGGRGEEAAHGAGQRVPRQGAQGVRAARGQQPHLLCFGARGLVRAHPDEPPVPARLPVAPPPVRVVRGMANIGLIFVQKILCWI